MDKTRPPRPSVRAKLPPKLAGILRAAREALARKDYQRAVHLARQSLYEGKTPDAFEVMTLAYCGLGDLTNAKAMLRNVPARRRRAVGRGCRRQGMDLLP